LSKLPDAARIVIIGGGAIGCSIAYHLAKLGQRDVLLLEKKALTAGSTWHAAGLVGQLRSRVNLTRLMQYSATLCASIGAETGQDVGFNKVGSIRLASSDARWDELKRNAAAAKTTGLDVALIGPGEIKDKFPLVDLKDVRGATWIASDGYVDPYSLTMAYAKGARAGGVKIVERVTVTGFGQANGRITHVVTDQGEVACEIAVNAGGLWARHVGEMAGIELPVTVLEHQYLVTEKSPLIPDKLPTLRDPDLNFYLKSEPGALAIGGWEQGTVAVNGSGKLPMDFGQELFGQNLDRFAEIAGPAAERIPVLNEVGIRTVINGPIPVSADGEPVIGLADGIENLFIACGFTSGIAASAGAGFAVANWIAHGDPGMDLEGFALSRFAGRRYDLEGLCDDAIKAYAAYYALSGSNRSRRCWRTRHETG
jgi:4-methylaminobutanoate oxidase (formaldehyde-forming)